MNSAHDRPASVLLDRTGRHAHVPNRRALPFPSSLGNGARRAGWGVARFFKPSRIARPSARTEFGADLLSTPHPPLRGTFPASRRRGDAPTARNSITCAHAVDDEQSCAAHGHLHRSDFSLARLVDERDLDIFWVPSTRTIVCHSWPTFLKVRACVARDGSAKVLAGRRRRNAG